MTYEPPACDVQYLTNGNGVQVTATYNPNGTIELAAISDGYRHHRLVVLFDEDTLDDAIWDFTSNLTPDH